MDIHHHHPRDDTTHIMVVLLHHPHKGIDISHHMHGTMVVHLHQLQKDIELGYCLDRGVIECHLVGLTVDQGRDHHLGAV